MRCVGDLVSKRCRPGWTEHLSDLEGMKNLVLQTNGTIYIIGPRKLQNELMASYLERETRAKCLLGEDICDVRFPDDAKCKEQPKLVLFDCHGKDLKSLLVALGSYGIEKLSRDYVALFNICHGLGIEKKCVEQGVRGIFYDDDSLSQFLKGVQAILNGQLWLSRKIMTKCILSKGWGSTSETDSSILTPRENEILALLAVGATNGEIAERLYISSHTVKTHLYNIYKKIDVPNRFQAALWTAKHL